MNHIKQINEYECNYTGAMAGLFDLDELTNSNDLDTGSVFIYMFRRFGYPRFGWDGQKTLVSYILTTPMEGVLLIVQPNVVGAGTFGYMLQDVIDRECIEEEQKPIKEWYKRLKTWAAETKGVADINITNTLFNGYIEVEPQPALTPIDDRPDESIMKQCQTALLAAIDDLRIPVMVRDVAITIDGKRVEISDDQEVIKCSEFAGIGVGDLSIETNKGV